MKFLFAFLLASIFTATTYGQDCPEGLEAFENTVFPVITNYCAGCHDGSKEEAPPFAKGVVEDSYKRLRNYVNFTNIDQSLLIDQAGNGHCGEEECEFEAGDEMLVAVNEWWEQGENMCNSLGSFFTEGITVESLPKLDEGYETLRIPLASIRLNLEGVFLEVQVQEYAVSDETGSRTIRFKSPRLVNGDKPLQIATIRLFVNDEYDAIFNQFQSVDKTVSFYSGEDSEETATPLLSSHMMLFVTESDYPLTIKASFTALDENEANACLSENAFTETVLPLLVNTCASCHSNQSSDYSYTMNLSQEDSALACSNVKEFTNTQSPIQSTLLSLINREDLGHPEVTFSDKRVFIETVKSWIEMERED